MQASSFDFSVTRDPWRLYITDAHYGSLGYADCHDWPILQGRYLLCLLLEYAATLGLIDVAYTDPDEARPDFRHMWGTDDLTYLSRYDGLRYFRLNPLGAYCLSVAETYEPGAPPAHAALTVFPDLRLHAHADLSPDEKLPAEHLRKRRIGRHLAPGSRQDAGRHRGRTCRGRAARIPCRTRRSAPSRDSRGLPAQRRTQGARG